jgi:hypothetical protein
MAIAKEGFSIFKPATSTFENTTPNIFISGLVTAIIRNPEDTGYTNPLDIGTIWFTNPEDPIPSIGSPKLLKAKPFFPNINQYPLVNEVVYILVLPSYEAQSFTTNVNFYYISPINLWGSQFLNYFKPNLPGAQPLNSSFPNELVSLGVPNQNVNDTNPSNVSQLTSKKFYKLSSKPGDISYEGRFGNSISFTSNGDLNPITIIRNGQPSNLNLPGWDRIPEDINRDKASIYLTEQGQILLSTGVRYNNSYGTSAPLAPDLYTENQIIINSGRVVINSQTDHTMIYGNKSVNINSQGSINFDSNKEFVTISPRIFLGTTSTEEPLVKGQTLYKILEVLLKQMALFTEACSIVVGVPEGNEIEPINTAAAQLNSTITQLQELLPKIKSDFNYTR